tara:strand:- start:13207 stop:13389 length:183 start_codon:yes stop_codon:yes gene_type:complete
MRYHEHTKLTQFVDLAQGSVRGPKEIIACNNTPHCSTNHGMFTADASESVSFNGPTAFAI